MISFNQSASWSCPLTPEEMKLAKVHRFHRQNTRELLREKITGERLSDERRAEIETAWANHRQAKQNCEATRAAYRARSEAFGFVCVMEGLEKWMQHMHYGIGRSPFNEIPPVPSFGMANRAFAFCEETNKIIIGIGSRIRLGGFYLEVLENSVAALNSNGTFAEEGIRCATALNSLLRGIGTDSSWGYDRFAKQDVTDLLQKIGVDTSRPFLINGTQFEMQGDKLRTVGETAKRPLQFWGMEGLNRLVQRAYAQNIF